MNNLKAMIFVFVVAIPTESFACTVFSLLDHSSAIVAKNFDWQSGQGLLLVNKRNVKKEAVFVGTQAPLKWTSKFMSLTFNMTGRDFPSEGMNEAGLSVGILVLRQSAFPPSTDPRPAVSGTQWLQYILDTSGSVKEAIVNAKSARISGPRAMSHYFVCDNTRQCATFEYINGQLVIHSGTALKYKALANDSYQSSESYAENLLLTRSPQTILNTPSNKSLDRFARAAIWSESYSGRQNLISYAFNALQNLKEENTQWNFVFNLENGTTYLQTRLAPQVKVISLVGFNPNCSSEVKVFNMNSNATGNVSSQFVDYTPEINRHLIEMNPNSNPDVRAILESYPENKTQCME